MKSNYSYKVGGDNFILSAEEHEKIVQGVKKGQSQFWLREGTLMINMSITWHVQQTNEPTESQRRERDNQLRLEPPKYDPPDEKRKMEVRQMVENWKNKRST